MLVILFISIVIVSCARSQEVKGNGQVTTVQRDVGVFTGVDLSGAYRLEIVQGKTQSVSVVTDSNIAPLVITRVSSGQLHVHNKSNVEFDTKQLPLIKVTSPKINSLRISGAGSVQAKDLKTTRLTVSISGAGRFTLQGAANDLTVNISGAGKVDAHQLRADNAEVHISGDGHVYLEVRDSLMVSISGSGYVEYYGSPEKVTQEISGAGKIIGVPLREQSATQNSR